MSAETITTNHDVICYIPFSYVVQADSWPSSKNQLVAQFNRECNRIWSIRWPWASQVVWGSSKFSHSQTNQWALWCNIFGSFWDGLWEQNSKTRKNPNFGVITPKSEKMAAVPWRTFPQISWKSIHSLMKITITDKITRSMHLIKSLLSGYIYCFKKQEQQQQHSNTIIHQTIHYNQPLLYTYYTCCSGCWFLSNSDDKFCKTCPII